MKRGPHRVMSIFGTRPEAIKLAPVIKKLRERPGQFASSVVVTAQHRQMLDQVLELFDIRPDHDLAIMREEQDLFDITTRALARLGTVIRTAKPDFLLVQGDTTTTFAAALAGFYLGVPVGHIEAGLRTFETRHPFPEEMNRRLTTAVADLHFAPTETARDNLLAEGVPADRIFVTGNTVVDALLETVASDRQFAHGLLSDLDLDSKRTVLVTAHRRESWGRPLIEICKAISRIVTNHEDVNVVFSVHLNPEVQKTVNEVLGDMPRVFLVDPPGYQPFVQLMNKCYLILTDSGGIQEEAPSLGKPVLVLREVTERPEGVEAGAVKVVGRNADRIVSEAGRLLDDPEAYAEMARAVNPYGDGHAAERIVKILADRLGS